MTPLKAGDVVTGFFAGSQTHKARPAVVVSTPAYHKARPDVLLALITSQIEKADTAFDATIYDREEAGLKLPSAMCSFLFTKPAKELIKIGHLSNADWSEDQARLKLALGLS